jgi:hypothetical protein
MIPKQRASNIVSGKGKKRLWKKWLVAFGVLIVIFCAGLLILISSIRTYERHRPLLDLQDSHLMTPRGPIPFKLSNRSAHYPDNENSAGKRIFVTIPASKKAPGFKVSLGIFNGSGRGSSPSVFLSDFTSTNGLEKIVIAPGAFYQLNQQPKTHLAVTQDSKAQLSTNLNFNWPKPLSDYNISMQGGSLPPTNVPIIKAGENNSHYMYLPFTFGAEEFSIHLRFRVSVNSFESIGTWGP